MRSINMNHLEIKNLKKYFNNKKVLTAINIILIVILLGSTFCIFYYTDFTDTLDNSVMLFKSIIKGEFNNYYHYAIENANQNTVYTANYNVFLYLLFMIWNLPIIIIHMINQFDYMNSIIAILWCKLFITTMTITSGFVLKKIISIYINDKKINSLGQILFLANSCVVIPTMVACQYDIVALFFILLGVYAFIKNNNKIFIIMFMIATPLKMFSLLIFIPLLLIKEKRIPFIIANIALVFLIQIIFQLPFLNDPWFELCMKSQNRDAIQILLDSNIEIFELKISLFIISFIAICVYAYKIREVEENIVYQKIYIASLAIASFVLFVKIRSYWIILSIPFLIMIIFFNKKYIKINILLFTIGTSCYTIYSFINHWIYSTEEILTKLILPLIIKIPEYSELRYGSIQNFFKYYDIEKYSSLIFSMFMASIIILFIINAPKSLNKSESQFEYKNWYSYLQIFMTFCIIILLLYSNMDSNGEYIYNLTDESSHYLNNNIFEYNIIKQSFKIEEKDKISEIHFKVKNNNIFREYRSAIKIEIDDGNEIIMEKIIGVSNINNENDNIIKFKEIEIKPENTYTINIVPIMGREKETPEIYFEMTDKIQTDKYPLYINEKAQKGNLVISIK